MKKLLKGCFWGIMAAGVVAATASAETHKTPGDQIPGTNLVRSYNYESGFLVGVFDAASNQETMYSAGKPIYEVMVADEDGTDEDLVVKVYEYEKGSLQTIEDLQLGETTHYGGSRDRPLYSKNHEGKKTESYIYNQGGFLTRVDLYGMVKSESDVENDRDGTYAKIGYREYDDHGRVSKQYSLEDPRDKNSKMIETVEYHYDGMRLTHTTGKEWNAEDEKWEERTTYFDSKGRPQYAENHKGQIVRQWNYEGSKLVSSEELENGNVTSRTYYDIYGRETVKYEVADGKEKNPTHYHYNDTNETIEITYKKDRKWSSSAEDYVGGKTETATVGPGGLLKTVSAESDSGQGYSMTWDEVTYFNYNKPQDTVIENFNLNKSSTGGFGGLGFPMSGAARWMAKWFPGPDMSSHNAKIDAMLDRANDRLNNR